MAIKRTRHTPDSQLFVKALGNRIRHFRELRGLTATAVSIAVGSSAGGGTCSNWERGGNPPATYELPMLASVLRVTMSELLGEEPTERIVHSADAAPMTVSAADRKQLRDEIQGTLWNTIHELVDIITDTAISTLEAQGVVAQPHEQKEAQA